MNVELALRVKERILREYNRVDMENWVKTKRFLLVFPCGTVCCIAGHAIEEGGSLPECFDDVQRTARILLGISHSESELLFRFHEGKERPYVDLALELANHLPGTLGYAQVVAKAIDRCIERNCDVDVIAELQRTAQDGVRKRKCVPEAM